MLINYIIVSQRVVFMRVVLIYHRRGDTCIETVGTPTVSLESKNSVGIAPTVCNGSAHGMPRYFWRAPTGSRGKRPRVSWQVPTVCPRYSWSPVAYHGPRGPAHGTLYNCHPSLYHMVFVEKFEITFK